MPPMAVALILAGGACILFGIRFALNLGGAADLTAARHRKLGNAHVFAWPRSGQHHDYRPQTTLGMRLAGVLFAFVGMAFILLSLLLSSFPEL